MSSCSVLFCILSFKANSSSIYSPSLARVVLVGSARQAGSHNNTRPLHCVLCCLLALCAAACLGNSADLEKNGRWTNFTSILISSLSQVSELIVSSSLFQATWTFQYHRKRRHNFIQEWWLEKLIIMQSRTVLYSLFPGKQICYCVKSKGQTDYLS